MHDNLIKKAGRARGARGQPPVKLVINPDSWFSVGVNVDRDHITLDDACHRARRARGDAG